MRPDAEFIPPRRACLSVQPKFGLCRRLVVENHETLRNHDVITSVTTLRCRLPQDMTPVESWMRYVRPTPLHDVARAPDPRKPSDAHANCRSTLTLKLPSAGHVNINAG